MILLDLLVLIVIGVAAWGIVWLVTSSRNRLDSRRKTVIAYDKQLHKVESRVREIANTTTDPDTRLQASILLDEIALTYESKELN